MNNKNSKMAIGMAVVFHIILLYTALASIILRQWRDLILSTLTMVCLILPFIFTRILNRKNIILPPSFQIIALMFVFLAQYLGEMKNLYIELWWWDLLLHAIFGSYSVIIALWSVKGIIISTHETTKQRFAVFNAIFAVSFSIAAGTLWEIFEYISDYVFGTNMIKGGLKDTSTDLIVVTLAALITSTIYYYRDSQK